MSSVDQISIESIKPKLINVERKIITLNQEDTLKETLKALAQNNILSAPVLDNSKKCIGLIDVLDCVSFAGELYYANKKESEFKNYLLQFSFDLQTVKNVMDLSKKNPFIPIESSTSVLKLLEYFANGIHRVIILDSNHSAQHVITQTNMLRFIFENLEDYFGKDLKESMNKSVEELNIGQQASQNKKIFTVPKETLAIDAFKLLSEHGISAIGIVDEKKNLIGNLSASDLQGFIENDPIMHSLGSSVIEFKKIATQKKRRLSGDSSVQNDLVICKKSTSFEEVIKRIGSTKVHRVYIMDGLNLAGIITLTDIFKFVYHTYNNQK